jgi:hypothetical protein
VQPLRQELEAPRQHISTTSSPSKSPSAARLFHPRHHGKGSMGRPKLYPPMHSCLSPPRAKACLEISVMADTRAACSRLALGNINVGRSVGVCYLFSYSFSLACHSNLSPT